MPHYAEPIITCPICGSTNVVHRIGGNAIHYDCMACRHQWKVFTEWKETEKKE